MSSLPNENELTLQIVNLTNLDSENKKIHFQKLIFKIQNEGIKFILPYINNLFQTLENSLKDENISIVNSASQLLLEIIKSSPKEIESNFKIVTRQLLINIGSPNSIVKEWAMANLITFLKLTQNSEILLVEILEYGINFPNVQTVKQIILGLINIISVQPSIIITSITFKNLIEKLLNMINKPEDPLYPAVSSVINYMNSEYNSSFTLLSKRLIIKNPDILQQIIDNFQTKSYGTLSPSKEIPSSDLKTSQNTIKFREKFDNIQHYYTQRIDEQKNELQSSPSFSQLVRYTIEQNQLEYGIFPTKIISNVNDEENWRSRAEAVEEMYHIVEQLTSLEPILDHIQQILKLILKLINDVNFKICLVAINILGLIINLMPDHLINHYKETLITNLIDKLGENKVAIRELSFNILCLFIDKITSQSLIMIILSYIKNENWHIREECLMLIKVILEKSEKAIDYQTNLDLLIKILEMLNDDKEKVRISALQTIITLLKSSNNENELLMEIEHLIDERIYSTIIDELNNQNLNNKKTNHARRTHSRGRSDGSYLHTPANEKRSSTIGRSPAKAEDMINSNERSSSIKGVRTRTQHVSCINMDFTRQDIFKNSVDLDAKYLIPNNDGSENIHNSMYKIGKEDYAYIAKVNYNSRNYRTKEINDGNYRIGYNTNFDTQKIDELKELNKPNSNTTSSPSPNTIFLQKKYINHQDISTASSSISGSSYHGNTPYSFNLPFSNSIHNGSKNQKQRFLPDVMNDQLRIQSAQVITQNNQSPLKLSEVEKRIYSANEALDNHNYSLLQNRLTHKVSKNEGYSDYTMMKNLRGQNFNAFGKIIYDEKEMNEYCELFPSNDSTLPSIYKNQNTQYGYEKTQNPYRTEKYQNSLKSKELVKAQEKEIDRESVRTNHKESRNEAELESRRDIPDNQKNVPFSTKDAFERKQNNYYARVTPNAYLTFEHEEITEKDESAFDDNEPDDKIQKNKIVEKDKVEEPKSAKKKATKAIASNQAEGYQLDYKKPKYLTKEELTPLEKNPESILKMILIELKSDDWSKQFDAMNNLRRLLAFHMNIIYSNNNFSIHQVTQEILKLIESLRSSLSKNAMITLTEMIQILKKDIDGELEPIVTKLIKKGMDTNSFISDEVKKGLIALCQNCSENRILSILFNLLNHKSTPAKLNICLCFEAIIQKNIDKITQLKDFDKIISALATYILDSSQEVRNASKTACNLLFKNSFHRVEIEKILQRNLNEDNFNKVLQIFTKELTQTSDDLLMITKSQQNTKKRSTKSKSITPNINRKEFSDDNTNNNNNKPELPNCSSQILIKDDDYQDDKSKSTISKTIDFNNEEKTEMTISKKKTNKMIFKKEGPAFENLPNVFLQADNTDWKCRYDAVTALTEFAQKNSTELSKSKLVAKYLDYVCKLITDSNTKVSLYAITSFTEIISLLKACVDNYSNNILNTTFTILGSVNSGIKAAAEILFNSLLKNMDYNNSIPCLCNGLLFANTKAKIIILTKLIENVGNLYEKKPQLITKNIVPTIIKMLDENKPELKTLGEKALRNYYTVVGKAMMDCIPSGKSQKINEILSQNP